MAQAGITVQLSVKEIYDRCCSECRAKIRELIREKISEEMLAKFIGE